LEPETHNKMLKAAEVLPKYESPSAIPVEHLSRREIREAADALCQLDAKKSPTPMMISVVNNDIEESDKSKEEEDTPIDLAKLSSLISTRLS
jgi:hypothetical protein